MSDAYRTDIPSYEIPLGRFIVIDLTGNNPGSQTDLGFGVCRHGFGLQAFGDGYMSEEIATLRAAAMNRGEIVSVENV